MPSLSYAAGDGVASYLCHGFGQEMGGLVLYSIRFDNAVPLKCYWWSGFFVTCLQEDDTIAP